MQATADDYKCPSKAMDWIFLSYNGHSAYLIIVDGALRQVYIFLTSLKEPPIHILHALMKNFGKGTSIIQTDQGSKLALSNAFCDSMLKDFGYVVETTRADSPSQNGGNGFYNSKLAVNLHILLYGSFLPSKFWSATMLHVVYLHNQLVHLAMVKTPYEGLARMQTGCHPPLNVWVACVHQTVWFPAL